MLDLAFIRNHPDIVKEAARVKDNTLDIDYLLEVDRRVLDLQHKVEEARAEQNKISKRVQQAGKDKALRDALIAEGKGLAEQIKALEPRLRQLEEERQQLLYLVPNIPDPSAPIGKDESDNVPIRYWGEKPAFDFEPLDHYASPLIVPAMAREFCFIGNGQFPKGRDQVYAIEDEDTFLVGTAEVSITGMYKDEILSYEDLPLTLVGFCPCFRKEAGTYGKDTRGVFRIHQFNKVEQYVICKADHEVSVRWHEQLIANSEELVQALELPYRVVNVCTGDMGDGKVGMYDLECWIPSEGRYRETHSCSYFHEWQARRVNIRYRDEDGKVKFVHTLNNTAIASPRILLPLFEVHQQPDGSVRIPEALRPFMGGQEYIRPREEVKLER